MAKAVKWEGAVEDLTLRQRHNLALEGVLGPMPIIKRPPVFAEDGTVRLQLTRGLEAIIDASDAELATSNWHAIIRPDGRRYAARRNNGACQFLHRAVLRLPPGSDPEVDHKDGDGLNCRRCNLRPVTSTTNRRNRVVMAHSKTGVLGVYPHPRTGKWRAELDGRTLGYFPTIEAAKAARVEEEKRCWGIEPRRRGDLE